MSLIVRMFLVLIVVSHTVMAGGGGEGGPLLSAWKATAVGAFDAALTCIDDRLDAATKMSGMQEAASVDFIPEALICDWVERCGGGQLRELDTDLLNGKAYSAVLEVPQFQAFVIRL